MPSLFWLLVASSGPALVPFAHGSVMVEADVVGTGSTEGLFRLRVVDAMRGALAAEIEVGIPPMCCLPALRVGERVFLSLSTTPASSTLIISDPGMFLRRVDGRQGQGWVLAVGDQVVRGVDCNAGYRVAPSRVTGLGMTLEAMDDARIAEAGEGIEWAAAMAAVRTCVTAIPQLGE